MTKGFNINYEAVEDTGFTFNYNPSKGSQTYVEALECAHGLAKDVPADGKVTLTEYCGSIKKVRKLHMSSVKMWLNNELEACDKGLK